MEPLVISQNDFLFMVDFMQSNYGINLSKKKGLIEARLQFVYSRSGCGSFGEFIRDAVKDPVQIDAIINRLTTNHTYFMRESAHFDYVKNIVLPKLEKEKEKKNKVISIWSAGCSSGEEPYTLSMILKDYFEGKPGGWDTRVLATDISHRAMAKAQDAVYEPDSIKDIPDQWRKKYFIQQDDGSFALNRTIRDNVIFRTFNLMEPIRFKLKFDVIFCRNVMIYFDAPTKEALVRRFYDATAPGGYLMVGLSETLNKAVNPYKMAGIGIYSK